MKVCGQTLILVDNDSTVSEVNQKITKATLKYMFYHAPSDRAFCLQNYEHELEDVEEYTTDTNELLCKLDMMEYGDKDSNLTDVLSRVLADWKESDFACRDILIFTDGLESPQLNYEKEELYYLISNTSYPIYIVDLVQDNNEGAKRQLSAIATTSGGKLFLSEFEGDEAQVDKQLTQQILDKMEEYAATNWSVYEELEDATTSQDVSEDEADLDTYEDDEIIENEVIEDVENVEEYLSDIDDIESEVIYEVDNTDGFIDGPGMIVFGLIMVLLAITLSLICGFIVMRKRRKNAKSEEEIKKLAYDNTIRNVGLEEDPFDESILFGFDEEYADSGTVLLNSLDEVDGTRLLIPEHKIVLINMDTNSRLENRIINKCIIGRRQGLCDIVIEDDSVSKKHCEITYEDGDFIINDLQSSNGTFVNDERIIKCKLHTDDLIKLGQHTYSVVCV